MFDISAHNLVWLQCYSFPSTRAAMGEQGVRNLPLVGTHPPRLNQGGYLLHCLASRPLPAGEEVGEWNAGGGWRGDGGRGNGREREARTSEPLLHLVLY